MLQDYEKDSDIFNGLQHVSPQISLHEEHFHYKPKNIRDKIAKWITRTVAELADFFFKERYAHRAIVLETVASVPGIIGGFFQHLKSLRYMRDDRGWIKTLLDEAENERVHLLIYSEIAKPTKIERFLIIAIQFFFCVFYFFIYLLSPRTAHRLVGYLEEEAVHSYEHFLSIIREGGQENIAATPLARAYWNLKEDARLSDMIQATIVDEMAHRDVNHRFSDDIHGTTMWK
jgi:ubiquinol oxidase